MSARTPTRESESEFPEPVRERIAPGQVWKNQTAHQRQQVYQILVQVCQELLRREKRDENVQENVE